jgi:hypothetical protein
VVEDAMGASWVDDEDFDIDHHVRTQRCAPARPERARGAAGAVGELRRRRSTARPLWQFHLIETTKAAAR